tara:strand:+ start:743 stop:1066 length:324 start_codon:yes stop_codon:yes gene_type:complete
MSKKKIDTKTLLQDLEKLIETTGENCGPILIKELETRMDKAINTFNNDMDDLLKESFDKYALKISKSKQILDSKHEISDVAEFEYKSDKSSAPQFIEEYEKKTGKKL